MSSARASWGSPGLLPIVIPRWGLVVLAAGVGRRYGGNRIKQLDPVGPTGEVLSDYSVRDAVASGAAHVVFVIRPELETAFRAHHARWRCRISLRYVHQRVPPGRSAPLGTTEAVVLACEYARDPVLVVNADDYYGPEAIAAGAAWLAAQPRSAAGRSAAATVTFPLRDTLSPHGGVSRAVVRQDETGRLTTMVEMHDLHPDSLHGCSGEEPVSINCWAFLPGALPPLRAQLHRFLELHRADPAIECRLPETIAGLVQEGQLEVTVVRGGRGWLGMTYAADRASVARSLRDIPPCS